MPNSVDKIVLLYHHAVLIRQAAALKHLSPSDAVNEVIANDLECYNHPNDLPGLKYPLGREQMFAVNVRMVTRLRAGARIVEIPETRGIGDDICRACPASRRPPNDPLGCEMGIQISGSDNLAEAYYAIRSGKGGILL